MGTKHQPIPRQVSKAQRLTLKQRLGKTRVDAFRFVDREFVDAPAVGREWPNEETAAVRSPRLKSSLSPGELKALRAVGFEPDANYKDQVRRVRRRTAANERAIVETALSCATVANMFDLSLAQVRKRIRARELWAIKIGTRYVLPRFQFYRGNVLTGWVAVLHALDAGLSTVAICNWMHLRTPEFAWAGKNRSPREWLIAKRPVDRVVRYAKDIAVGM
jgi:hypothetical protein